MTKKSVETEWAAAFIEMMAWLPVTKVPDGREWAGALRARDIILTNVKLRPPSRRRITIADIPARDCFDECFGLLPSIDVPRGFATRRGADA